MSVQSLLSYYPTYGILDEVLSYSKDYDTLYIYIDLKNNLQTMYMEHAIVNMVENTKLSGYYDTSPFMSLLSFLSFHKIYSSKRNIKIKFFIFFESGESYYHKNISKKYKISRKVDNLYGLDFKDRELFFETMRANYTLIEKVFSVTPFTKVVRMLNLEADFIPYFLTTRNVVDTSNNVAHIVYSNDHDIYQTVNNNVFQFIKSPQTKKILKKGEVMDNVFKTKTELPDEYLPLYMAICGDTGDDVDGIKGIGPKTFLKNVSDIIKMCGGMNQLYNNVLENKPIFDSTGIIKNKYLNLLIEEETKNNRISNNLKLVSFELISRFFEFPSTTEVSERKTKLLENLTSTKTVNLETIRKVLEMQKVFIYSDELEVLYYNS